MKMEGGFLKGGGLRGWLARGLGKVVYKRVGFMRMADKEFWNGGWQKGGVYEDGWLGVGERWVAKGGGL